MSLLVISGAVIRMGGRILLNGADLTVDAGRRIGLVGRNGAGKSTLLRAIAGEMPMDGGDIRLAARARMAQVRQEAPSGPATCWTPCWKATRSGWRCWPRPRPPARIAWPRCMSGCAPSAPTPPRRAPPPSWPGWASTRAAQAPPGGRVLRRLAHARGAGDRAVRQPRPAAAGRADQPSRPGGDAVAGDAGSPAFPVPR